MTRKLAAVSFNQNDGYKQHTNSTKKYQTDAVVSKMKISKRTYKPNIGKPVTTILFTKFFAQKWFESL